MASKRLAARLALALTLTVVGCARGISPTGAQAPGAPAAERPTRPREGLLTTGSGNNNGAGNAFFVQHTGPTGELLREPPVLPNHSNQAKTVEVDITAGDRDVPLFDGPATHMTLFNGSFPGPLLEAHEGDKVIVHFHNRTTIPTNLHFHGMIIPTEQDGNPMQPVAPGEDHDYNWTAKVGFPMFSWYHTHAHGFTHIGVARGLEAPLRILASSDPLPAAYGKTILQLADGKFDANNQIPPDDEFDRINGREGNILFVNGQVLPKLVLRPGEIRRLQIGDFASARFFRLAIPGVRMWQVGTDGGLIEHPVPIGELLLANAERAEVLIQAPSTPHATYTVLDLPYDRGLGFSAKVEVPLPLMTIETSGDPVQPPPIPTTMRHIEPIPLGGAAPRLLKLDQLSVGGGAHHFGINGAQFDPLRIDNVATHGSTEIWTIKNTVGKWDHPMHLHSTQFQVLDVDGRPPVTGPAWKDTVLVPKNTRARFAVRFIDDRGLYMFHCHILQHENEGMMTTVMIDDGPAFQLQNPPPTEDPTAPDARVQPLPITADPKAPRATLALSEAPAAAWCGPNGARVPAPPPSADDVLARAGLNWWLNGRPGQTAQVLGRSLTSLAVGR